MNVTSRFAVFVALAGFAVCWSLIIEHALPIVCACGLVAWLLVQQYRFSSMAASMQSHLALSQSVSRSRAGTDETTIVTYDVTADDPLPVSCTFRPKYPAGSDAPATSFELSRGATGCTETREIRWPVAGAFTIDPPTVSVTDTLGLFETTLNIGDSVSVVVEPRTPRNIHVGEGGDPVTAGLGEHETEQTGRGGLEPEEVRQYVPGDTIRSIDWKATARLNEPHVREFETETDRRTVLFVDHRSSLRTGRDGETKLDFLRQVGLAFVEHARDHADPLGCYTVGTDGLTGSFPPSADPTQQVTIRHHLQSLEPTVDQTPSTARSHQSTPGRPSQLRQRLQADESAFSAQLAPYFDRPNTYVSRILDQPLVGAVRAATTQSNETLWSVILTDDTNRTKLRETVKLARHNQGRVLVFLAPTVIYEPGELRDLDEAYDRYMAFEQFRRSLAGMDRVTAFEVGPADRLSAVLARGTTQHRTTQEKP